MANVCIIIPTYNEAEILADTIQAVMQVINQVPQHRLCILIFDSDSTDNTPQIIKKLQAQYSNLYCQTEADKTGLGSAYAQAIEYAIEQLAADIIFEYDADGSHQPCYITAMLAYFDDPAVDVVNASRFIENGAIPKDWGIRQKFFSVAGNYLARFLLTNKIKDHTSGFRASKAKILKNLDMKNFISKNYAYKIQLLFTARQQGANIVEHPIKFINRNRGISKAPKNNALDSLRVVFQLFFRKSEKFTKMCIVGLVGMLVQFIAFNALRHILSPVYATLISVEFAIINNFFLNHCWTFSGGKALGSLGLRFLKFNTFSLSTMALQSLVMLIITKIFGRGLIIENSGLFAAIAITLILKYRLYTKFVWPMHDSKTENNLNA